MRLLYALCLALLAPLPAVAADCASRGQPAVWRIADADSSVTMIGTVHRLRPGDYRIPESLTQRPLDVVAFESRTMSAWATLRMALQARAPQDLEDAVTQDQWAELRGLASELDIPQTTLQRLDPFMLAATLDEKAAGRVGREQEHGADSLLKRELGRRSDRVTYLEDQRDVFRLIRSISYASKVEFLLDTVRRLKSPEPWSFADAWLAGNECEVLRQADVISKQAVDEPHYREINDGLTLSRNRRFADGIAELLDTEGEHAVAVGAFHFYGDGNIRELLEARGLTVTDLTQGGT